MSATLMPVESRNDEETGIDRLLASLAAHRRGALAEAEAGYRDVLAETPAHPVALRLLGLLLLGDGRAARAVDVLRAAVAAKGDDAEAQTALGDALLASGDLAGAVGQYRFVLERWPGQHAARVNLANALRDGGDVSGAIAECRLVVAVAPRLVAGHVTLGASLLSAGRTVEAIGAYRTAVQIAPEDAVARAGYALALLRERRAVDALEAALRACETAPRFAEAWFVRGMAERMLGRHGAAKESLRKAVDIAPGHAPARLALGNTLADMDRLDAAVTEIRGAMLAAPGLAEAPASLSAVLQGLGRTDEAIAAADAALAIRQDFAEARALRGSARLMGGDLAGLADFAARLLGVPVPETPMWDGSAPAGRRLLVLAEEGAGDTIQFARFLPELAMIGAEVVLACPAPLLGLMRGMGVTCVPIEAGWPGHDAWVWLMDVPWRLGTRLETIPGARGYLNGAGTEARSGKRKVGLAWAGNPAHRNDARRSLPTSALAPLAGVDVAWMNLQQDGRGPELAIMHRMPAPTRFADWAATAAAVAGLDLVITADTAVAHLAGALGRPVWVMLPWAADWRWMRKRTDSPWYDSARLFRQERAGDWDGVVARVAEALRREG